MSAPPNSSRAGSNVDGVYASRRGPIGVEDIAFVLRKRAATRAGWQACAAMIDRSEADLRAAADPDYPGFVDDGVLRAAWVAAGGAPMAVAPPPPPPILAAPSTASPPRPAVVRRLEPPPARPRKRAPRPGQPQAACRAAVSALAMRQVMQAIAGLVRWTPSVDIAAALGVSAQVVGGRLRFLVVGGNALQQQVGEARFWFLSAQGFAVLGLEPRAPEPALLESWRVQHRRAAVLRWHARLAKIAAARWGDEGDEGRPGESDREGASCGT